MSRNKITIILLLLILSRNHPAFSAQKGTTPLITYRCDTAADIVVITNSLLSPGEAKTFTFNDDRGTYNPWDLVKIDHIKQKMTPIRKKTIVKKCVLSSGEYITTIEPKIFSRELTGACGKSISGVVTIEFDGFEIFEKRAFEDYCHGNAPIITRVTAFGKTMEVKIRRIPKYKFY